MTPKEKAESLADRMYFVISNNGQFTGIHSIPNKFAEAKKCAIIAVNEMIEELIVTDFANRFPYWQEVKQEIEKYGQQERTI
jgi:hypothetical protein